MKKRVIVLMVCLMCIGMGVTAYAAEEKCEVNQDAVIIREDVSRQEAIQDRTFSILQADKMKLELEYNSSSDTITSRAVSWNVWGERKFGIVNGIPGYTPYGYSEHVNGTTVLDTYHYTRTYLGEIMKKGDSGRCWGNGTVCAKGTFCDEDVNMSYTQIVKYGTED